MARDSLRDRGAVVSRMGEVCLEVIDKYPRHVGDLRLIYWRPGKGIDHEGAVPDVEFDPWESVLVITKWVLAIRQRVRRFEPERGR